MRANYKNVDEYIKSFPKDTQERLEQVRAVIKKTAPGAEESMSYGMPAYKIYGRVLVYFAGYSRHIGFYATPSGHTEFKLELARYKQGKGSVQFPHEKPLPLNLIFLITKFRVEENAVRKRKK